jgi:flagellin-like protein
MQLYELVRDDQAVSEVVGVVLMVAITVLLAATAASFFLGLTNGQQSTSPRVAITFDYDASNESPPEDSLKITHEGGGTVDAERVDVVVSDAAVPGDVVEKRYTWAELSGGSASEVAAGMSVTVDRDTLKDPSSSSEYSDLSLDTANVKVIWLDTGSDQTFVLGRWDRTA